MRTLKYDRGRQKTTPQHAELSDYNAELNTWFDSADQERTNGGRKSYFVKKYDKRESSPAGLGP